MKGVCNLQRPFIFQRSMVNFISFQVPRQFRIPFEFTGHIQEPQRNYLQLNTFILTVSLQNLQVHIIQNLHVFTYSQFVKILACPNKIMTFAQSIKLILSQVLSSTPLIEIRYDRWNYFPPLEKFLKTSHPLLNLLVDRNLSIGIRLLFFLIFIIPIYY